MPSPLRASDSRSRAVHGQSRRAGREEPRRRVSRAVAAMTRPAVALAATSSASRGFSHARVVRAGRRPVATPAEVRPAVVRRPARPPPRGRATARAIPSGPNETDASKGTRANVDAQEEDASALRASDVSASEDPSRHPSGSSSSSSTAEGNANASQKPFDWDDVGPGLVPSVATACLGAFLFGYHSAVINAPLGAIADDLGFAGDVAAKGAVVSVLVAGGFLGGLGIGPLADAQGRRAALFATTVPLTIGTLISASADSFGAMTIGRLVTGVGVGASSQIVPLYLSEVSPPNLRGTVNGVRRVAYVIGCLLAFQAAVPLQKPPPTPSAAEGASKPAEATATRTSAPETKAPSSPSSPSSGIAIPANAVAPETRVTEPAAVTKNPERKSPSSMPSSSETGVVKPSSAESSAPNRDATTRAVAASAPSSSAPPSVSNWSGGASFSNDDSSSRTVAEFLRTFGTEAAERTAPTPATKDPAPTAPPPLASPLEYPSASPPAAAEGPARASSRAAETPAEDAATRKSPVISANASEKTTRTDVEKRAETQTTRTAALIPETPPALASAELAEPKPEPKPAAPATKPTNSTNPTYPNARASNTVVTPERKPEKLPPLETLSTKAEARLETKPVRLAPAESAKKVAKEKESSDAKTKSLSTKKNAPAPGWWRPLFYWAAAPAFLLAMSTAGGVAVESPVWLLGPEGCAMESRRALAKLLNLRGRAAVRWQESVSGAVGRIAVGKARAGRVVRSGDEGDAEEDAEEEDTRNVGSVVENRTRSGSAPSGDRTSDDDDDAARAPAGEPAAQSWSALLEDRNRQPVIIGLGLCFLAAFSGSNTVIYFASSVLQEAGLTDPGLLTTAVGVPNLLGGVVALVATDAFGRRPLLLLSFGGMSLALAALSIASALTPGVATESFCALPVPSPEEFSGLPCVACDALAAICDDLPAPVTSAAAVAQSFEPQRTVALVAIPAYTLLFSLGAGPVPWLLYNEVFPTRIRARATSLCTAINYLSNTVVGASFLPLVSGIGLGGTYGLYATLCFAGFLFVDRFVFETKGLRLEDVEGVMAERERKWRDEK